MTTKPIALIFILLLTISCKRQKIDTEWVVNKDAVFNPGLGWVHLEENESIGPYTRIHNKIFCGEVGCGDHPLKMVDVATFEVWPGTEFARDKERVFFPEQMICVCGDSCSVCFNDNPILEGANPASFRCLEPEVAVDNYAKYVRGKREAKQDSGKLKTGWYYLTQKEAGIERKLNGTEEVYFINPAPIVTVAEFQGLEVYQSNYGDFALSITLNNEGTIKWRDATGSSIGGKLALIIDDELYFTPLVKAQIDNGQTALNRRDLTKRELIRIKNKIETDIE